MKKKAIVFDLDDTLSPDHAAVDAAFLAACKGVANLVEPATLVGTVREKARELWISGPHYDYLFGLGTAPWEGLLGAFDSGHHELLKARAWAPGYRQSVWDSALAAHSVSDSRLAATLSEAFADERWRICAPYSDVLAGLEDLQRDYALGMLTNGIPDIQHKKMGLCGISGYFISTVISGDIGFGKPDPRVFHRVLGDLGVSPEEAVMVGNSPKRDVAGAQGVGVLAVQIAREREERADGVKPDALIRTLDELREVIE